MPQTSSRRVHSLSAAAPLTMRSRVDGDRRIISLSGELDVATAQTLERELEPAEPGNARVTVLDLRGLDFMDCSGLRVIFNAHRRASHRLLVVKGPEHVQRVFELCGLHEVLAFDCETRDRGERPAGSLNGVTRAGVDRPTGSLRAATARRAEQGALAAAVRDLRSRSSLRPVRQQGWS